MKIAIIPPGELPIPAVQGGAIETLVTQLLDLNETSHTPVNFFVFNKSSYISKNQYKYTTIITVSRNKIYDFLTSNICRVLRKLFGIYIFLPTSYGFKTNLLIKKIRFDCVLVEGNYYDVLQISKKNRIIFHLHTDILTQKTPFYNKILSKIDTIICVSQFILYSSSLGQNKYNEKFKVLKNQINTQIFKFDITERIKQRNIVSLDNEVFIVGFVGRISKEKGVFELVQAFEKVLLKDKSIKLMIVGSSWFSDNRIDSYTHKVLEASKGIKDNLYFTGYVENKELYKYYSTFDVLVVPSQGNEAAGLVILEAHECDLKVIASKVGGIPEYLDDNDTLIPLNSNYTENLSNEILKIKSNYNAMIRMKKNNNINNHQTNYLEEFLSIVKKGGL